MIRINRQEPVWVNSFEFYKYLGDDTIAFVKDNYSLLTPNENHKLSEPNEEVKKSKENTKWTDKMKESLINLKYKFNHSGSSFSQYSKLDYKNCKSKPIRIMWGHYFNLPKCQPEVEKVFKNIILFTYRKAFSNPLESIDKKTGKPINFNTDFGWGCMIRCGQMMLANALLIHLKYTIFSSEKRNPKSLQDAHRGLAISDIHEIDIYENIEKEVISKFLDSKRGNDAPFSIGEVTDQGLDSFHKVAGDWYGTNSISQVLRELNIKHKPYEDFEILVFNDGVFFKQDVIDLGSEVIVEEQKHHANRNSESSQSEDYFEQTREGKQSGGSKDFKDSKLDKKSKSYSCRIVKEESKNQPSIGSDSSSTYDNTFMHNNQMRRWNKWVLVIINTRLGLSKIPTETYPEISNIFEIPQMVGILGGKGKFGLYFVGAQKDNLILLDPHINQDTIQHEDEIKQNRKTLMWEHIRTIKIK